MRLKPDVDCGREEEIFDVVATGRWPGRCEPELAAHLERCDTCRDLVAVITALSSGHEAAWTEARVPPSAMVWWRAQAKAREEAVRSAARPIAFTQGVAAAGAVWISVSLLRMAPGQVSLGWLPARAYLAAALTHIPAALSSVPGGTAFAALVGGSLVLAPIALLLVARAVLREE